MSFWTFKCLDIQMFGHSNVWTFKCLDIQMFGHSNVWTFKCLDIQMFGHSNVWTSKCLDIQMFGHSNVWTFKCLDIQMFGHSNVWTFKCTHSFLSLTYFLSYLLLKYLKTNLILTEMTCLWNYGFPKLFWKYSIRNTYLFIYCWLGHDRYCFSTL